MTTTGIILLVLFDQVSRVDYVWDGTFSYKQKGKRVSTCFKYKTGWEETETGPYSDWQATSEIERKLLRSFARTLLASPL